MSEDDVKEGWSPPEHARQRTEAEAAGEAEFLAAVLAKHGTPVVDAMRYWLAGDVSVPSLAEFFDRYGKAYRDHLRTLGTHDWHLPLASMGDTIGLFHERDQFIREFGFGVPTREALDRICAFSPLLEIGAGSGAWARLLAMRGADIIATDPHVESFVHVVVKGVERWTWEKMHHPVLPLAGKTAVRRWRTRNVFCCWPSLSQTWLRQAARAMLPGRALIVVREDATADQRTWGYVEHHFKPVGESRTHGEEQWIDNSLELPNWGYLHDHLEVWIKKSRRELAETPAPEVDDDLEVSVDTAMLHLADVIEADDDEDDT
jgi:hypothetical protein